MRKYLAVLLFTFSIAVHARQTMAAKPAPAQQPVHVIVDGAPVPAIVHDQPVTVAKLPPVSTEAIRDRVDYITLVISIALLIVGYFGVRYAKKTLAQIAEQTKRLGEHAGHLKDLADAAKDNAAAAAANAEAVKKSTQVLAISERAWVVEEIDFPNGVLPFPPEGVVRNASVLSVAFEVRNGGKSAAMITDLVLRFQGVQSLTALPSEPFYGGAVSLPEIGSGLILVPVAATKAPTKVAVILETGSGFLTRQDVLAINAGQAELVVFGKIEYQSLGVKHVNQFCYVWYKGIGLEGDRARFRKIGPPEYNSHS